MEQKEGQKNEIIKKELKQLKERIIESVNITQEPQNSATNNQVINDQTIQEKIEQEVKWLVKKFDLSFDQRRAMEMELFYSLRKLDILQELVDDEDVTEIMVNGYKDIFYEKEGSIFKWNKCFTSKEKLDDIIQQIVASNNRIVNESSPIVDTRLENGSRVNVVLPPISLGGSIISIRKFPKDPISMNQLIKINSISKEAADFLKELVYSGYNIFVSGGTGSGKTTFLNALSEFIPKEERVITIEDSAELKIKGIENLIRLETRNANVQGKLEVNIRELIKSSLRMRPNRIIIGECRGAEALDMLQAMNTGHNGSLSTGHSNSNADMVYRLETMVLMGMDLPIPAIRSQIASGIDLFIHLSRLRDKSRKVVEISEVKGIENGEIVLNKLFQFKEKGVLNHKIDGVWERVGTLIHQEKKYAAGR